MSDLISRKKLLEQIEADSEGREGQYGDEWLFIDTINAIPNAETTGALDDAIQEYIKDGYILAEPKVGKWVEHPNHIECPYCKVWFLKDYMPRNSYCPNCGAKLERSE